MGWWILDSVPDDADAFFRSELARADQTVLDTATVPGSVRRVDEEGFIDVTLGDYVWYAAILDDATGAVSCMTALYCAAPPFRYSANHETEAPDLATCPAHILDSLTPLEECHHAEVFCRYCDAEVIESADARWISVDVPAGDRPGANLLRRTAERSAPPRARWLQGMPGVHRPRLAPPLPRESHYLISGQRPPPVTAPPMHPR